MTDAAKALMTMQKALMTLTKTLMSLPKALMTMTKALMTLPKSLMTMQKALMSLPKAPGFQLPGIFLSRYGSYFPLNFNRFPSPQPKMVKLSKVILEKVDEVLFTWLLRYWLQGEFIHI